MNTDNIPPLLARLESGLRTDVARLKQLENELAETLHDARGVGTTQSPQPEWNTRWQELWSRAELSLKKIQTDLQAIQEKISSSETDRLQQALSLWESIVTEDQTLIEIIASIRSSAEELSGAVRQEWNIIAATLDSHFDTIHAFGQALRVKLELLKEHSSEDVNILLDKVLTHSPFRSDEEEVGGEKAPEDYNLAAVKINQERHKFLGLGDIAKAMLLWVDNPEERLTKKLAVRLD